MSNTRKYNSLLDDSQTYDKDNWLVSIAYKKEVGPMVLLEGASERNGRPLCTAYSAKLVKNQRWQITAGEPDPTTFSSSYYRTFSLSKDQTTELLNELDEIIAKKLEMDSDSSSESDNDNQRLFSKESLERKTQNMHKEFYKGIVDKFNSLIGYDNGIEIPTGLQGFTRWADFKEPEVNALKPN